MSSSVLVRAPNTNSLSELMNIKRDQLQPLPILHSHTSATLETIASLLDHQIDISHFTILSQTDQQLDQRILEINLYSQF